MQGLFNCSFAANETLVNLCCPPGNSTILKAASCNVTDSGALGTCLQKQGAAMLDCSTLAQGFVPLSSSRRRWNSPVALLVFALVATTVAASPTPDLVRRETKCTKFDPAPQSEWDFKAVMGSKRLSDIADCGQSGLPCMMFSNKTVEWAVEWDLTNVTIDVDPKIIASAVGGTASSVVTSVPISGLSVPMGQKGYLAAYAHAVKVPGTLTCGDQRYQGSALVPDRRVTVNIVIT